MKTSNDGKQGQMLASSHGELLTRERRSEIAKSDDEALILMQRDLHAILTQVEVGIERIELFLSAIEVKIKGRLSPRDAIQGFADLVKDVRYGVSGKGPQDHDGLIQIRDDLKKMQTQLLLDTAPEQKYLSDANEGE